MNSNSELIQNFTRMKEIFANLYGSALILRMTWQLFNLKIRYFLFIYFFFLQILNS